MTDDIGTTNPFDDDKLHEECGVFGIYARTAPIFLRIS